MWRLSAGSVHSTKSLTSDVLAPRGQGEGFRKRQSRWFDQLKPKQARGVSEAEHDGHLSAGLQRRFIAPLAVDRTAERDLGEDGCRREPGKQQRRQRNRMDERGRFWPALFDRVTNITRSNTRHTDPVGDTLRIRNPRSAGRPLAAVASEQSRFRAFAINSGRPVHPSNALRCSTFSRVPGTARSGPER